MRAALAVLARRRRDGLGVLARGGPGRRGGIAAAVRRLGVGADLSRRGRHLPPAGCPLAPRRRRADAGVRALLRPLRRRRRWRARSRRGGSLAARRPLRLPLGRWRWAVVLCGLPTLAAWAGEHAAGLPVSGGGAGAAGHPARRRRGRGRDALDRRRRPSTTRPPRVRYTLRMAARPSPKRPARPAAAPAAPHTSRPARAGLPPRLARARRRPPLAGPDREGRGLPRGAAAHVRDRPLPSRAASSRSRPASRSSRWRPSPTSGRACRTSSPRRWASAPGARSPSPTSTATRSSSPPACSTRWSSSTPTTSRWGASRRHEHRESRAPAWRSIAGCVAVVGGVLLKDAPRQQARSAAEIFGSLVGAALVLGWMLYFLPI